MHGFDYFLISLVLANSALSVWSQEGFNHCPPGRIPCDSGGCTRRNWWCDGDTDCSDGSDEMYCNRFWNQLVTCDTDRHFTCHNRKCIPKVLKCDTYDDCGDFSDEEQCDFDGYPLSSEMPYSETQTSISNYTHLDITEIPYSEATTDFSVYNEKVPYSILIETPTTTSLPQNPSTNSVPRFLSPFLKSNEENRRASGPSRPGSDSDLVNQPESIPQGSSPVTLRALDPRNPYGLPRKYFDLSVNFPSRHHGPARDVPRLNDQKPSQNQGMVGQVSGCSKSGSSSYRFGDDNERYLVDQQYQNVGKADEEMSSSHALRRQNEDAPNPLVAIFLFAGSSPVNIRVNDESE